MHNCAETCPFTTGVACQQDAPVVPVPPRARHMTGEAEHVCAPCWPKLELAYAQEQDRLAEERRVKREAKVETRAALKNARGAALAAQQAVRDLVEQASVVAGEREARIRTAEGRAHARAAERARLEEERHAREVALQRARIELEEAEARLAAQDEIDAHALRQADVRVALAAIRGQLRAASALADLAWGRTTTSYRKKHRDHHLGKLAAELLEAPE